MATLSKSKLYTAPDDEFLAAMGPGSGSGGGGIGGGGGSPSGGTPGGGGGGGGGEDLAGNNLSFPAIFLSTAPTLRGTMGNYTFTTPATTTLGEPGYVYFAQGVEGNTWQADSLIATTPVTVDYVDIGDALESAPLKAGANVRMELTLYQDLLNLDTEEPGGASLTGFSMTVLGGAKGGGKPTTGGATESQGARVLESNWSGSPLDGSAPFEGTTFESDYASINAGDYMSLSIQKVTGLESGSPDTGLDWVGGKWVDANPDDGITVGDNLLNTGFGPELNIAGKYIMGASGKPFKFTADGNYLVTFAVDNGAPLLLDANTLVANFNAGTLGFDALTEARPTEVIADGETHNGLLVMLVGVPSEVGGGEEPVG